MHRAHDLPVHDLPRRSARRRSAPGSKETLFTFTDHFQNIGGSMPFVDPKECAHRRLERNVQKDGVVYWMENALCKKCDDRCDRYREYWRNGGKDAHMAELERRWPKRKRGE